MLFKKWQVNQIDRTLASELSEECDIDPFVALVAAGRGYTDPVALDEFLTEDIILADPYEMADIEKAAEIINNAIYSEQKIAVFGDYDVDGVTATVLMYSYLKNRGADVSYHIPDREKDGYGINMSAIDRLNDLGCQLIITVDNGIAAISEIEYAKSLGMSVVVTDHHLPKDELPQADAVVNPHRPDDYSEFKEICGVFVAYKVVCAVEGSSPEELLADYGDLVAIGTVGDVMPLIYENRVVVREGVSLIANGSRRGLSALLKVAGIEDDALTATRLAFGIVPRLNAAGRMGDAARAAQLLLTDDDEEAQGLAALLGNENIRRQALEKQIMTEAVSIIEKKGYKHNRVIVVSGEGWHGGVIGIVAARLCEKYGRPAIVLSCADGIANGSARSIKGFSIYDALSDCSYLLAKFGGHEMAAGLTLYESSVDSFRRAINEYAATLPKTLPLLQLDCKLNPAALSVELADAIKTLEPFGAGNPVPMFGLFGVRIEKLSPVGQGKHLRLTLSKGEVSFSAMLFGTPKNAFAYDIGDTVDLAVTLDTNFFNNTQSLTVSVKDIRKNGINDDRIAAELDLYESFKSDLFGDYEDINPTREEIGAVFKSILNKPQSLDRIQINNLDSVGCAKALIAAQALCELKLCSVFDVEGTPFVKVTSTQKVNLADAPVLQKLRGEYYGA
ncbi:MAG: single-stranded-DNA-specific exonuclease RecJ [Clostridia bacterium]|nr:single-stranded-DNA-specific exonuclease RecJ [Clostridia bacterium]